MKVQVKSPRYDVTLGQAIDWFLRHGFEGLDGRAIDSHGFRHVESRAILLVPKAGCFDMSGRMSRSIEDCADILGVEALTILREISEVAPWSSPFKKPSSTVAI